MALGVVALEHPRLQPQVSIEAEYKAAAKKPYSVTIGDSWRRRRALLAWLGYGVAVNDQPLGTAWPTTVSRYGATERQRVAAFQADYNRFISIPYKGWGVDWRKPPIRKDGIADLATERALGQAFDAVHHERGNGFDRNWFEISRYGVFSGPLGSVGGHPRRVETITTDSPAPTTLAIMGRTARDAADTYTLRRWAAKLATKAGPKDYRGQLEQLYHGILDRWRYVQEADEWVHGTPRSLLGTVLGLDDAPGVTDPTRVDLATVPKGERGWGDCDDVSTLAAAGVQALGMRPLFRVSRASSGQAHVSVTAITPTGEVVQIDPVGHPNHKFGWAQAGPDIAVTYHDMDGRALDVPQSYGATTMQPAAPYTFAPQFYPQTMIPGAIAWHQAPYGFGSMHTPEESTYLGVLAVTPNRAGLSPYQARVRRHLVVVSPNDSRGARVLACPGFVARSMLKGIVLDGATAVDQFGEEYTYRQPLDLWVPSSSIAARRGTYGMGASKAERRARRKARRRKVFKKIGRFFKKIGAGIRKVFSKIMGSKFVQTIVAGFLQVFGVPMALTKKLLAVASKFVGSGGFIKLFRSLRKNPKKALKNLAKVVKAAGRSDLLKQIPGFKGFGQYGPSGYEPVVYEVSDRGGTPFYAAPVEGIVGLDGVLGDAGEGAAFSEEPRGGYYYRIRKGDNLSDVAQKAYGKALPGARWISESATNQYATVPSKTDYAKKYIGPRIVSFLPDYSGTIPGGPGNTYAAIWIPPVGGVEPSVVPVIPDDAEPEPDPSEPEPDDMVPDEPSPGPVPVPPVPADEPEDSVIDEEPEPAPSPEPPVPVEPVEPEDEPIPVEPEPKTDPIPSPYPYDPVRPDDTPSRVDPITPSGPPLYPDGTPMPSPSPSPAGSSDMLPIALLLLLGAGL